MEDRVTNPRDRHNAEAVEEPVLPCLGGNLRRAARLVSQLYESEPGWPNLGIPDLALLRAIARGGTIAHASLGSLLALDETTVSRSLATLRRRHWVRTSRGDDRRDGVVLTEVGKLQLQRGNRAWRRAQARFRRRYGAEKWDAMQRALTALAEAIPMMVRTSRRGSRASK
jgi:DNA-binding MarR family transcriptional regulator